MTAHNHLISIKTIADHHLEDFMRCPYHFYQKQILGKKVSHSDWREMVQYAVNQVVSDYYALPPMRRSASIILELIQRHWFKKVELFDSKLAYYQVLAKVTDHLLLSLLQAKETAEPALLFEKLRVTIEELEIELAMTLQVVEWSGESYIVKKFFVEEDENILTSYQHLTILFCQQAFGALPERIEMVSVLTGQTHLYSPQIQDVSHALDYLKLTKHVLQESKNYTKCHACSVQEKINQGPSRKVKEIQFVM